MTKLLDQAVEAVRALPPEQQDDAARGLLTYVESHASDNRLTGEQIAEVDQGLREADAGNFLTEAETKALFRRLGV